jgi:hypothetical protein
MYCISGALAGMSRVRMMMPNVWVLLGLMAFLFDVWMEKYWLIGNRRD